MLELQILAWSALKNFLTEMMHRRVEGLHEKVTICTLGLLTGYLGDSPMFHHWLSCLQSYPKKHKSYCSSVMHSMIEFHTLFRLYKVIDGYTTIKFRSLRL